MFSRCSQDVCRIFPGCFQDAPMGLVGLMQFDDHLNESMDYNDLKELDDPQLFQVIVVCFQACCSARMIP